MVTCLYPIGPLAEDFLHKPCIVARTNIKIIFFLLLFLLGDIYFIVADSFTLVGFLKLVNLVNGLPIVFYKLFLQLCWDMASFVFCCVCSLLYLFGLPYYQDCRLLLFLYRYFIVGVYYRLFKYCQKILLSMS